MPFRIAGSLRQGLPFTVDERQLHRRLRSAVFQALGKHIQLIVITVQRHANVTEGKQRRGIAVAILPRRIHHGDIDAGLLQRRNVF